MPSTRELEHRDATCGSGASQATRTRSPVCTLLHGLSLHERCVHLGSHRHLDRARHHSRDGIVRMCSSNSHRHLAYLREQSIRIHRCVPELSTPGDATEPCCNGALQTVWVRACMSAKRQVRSADKAARALGDQVISRLDWATHTTAVRGCTSGGIHHVCKPRVAREASSTARLSRPCTGSCTRLRLLHCAVECGHLWSNAW